MNITANFYERSFSRNLRKNIIYISPHQIMAKIIRKTKRNKNKIRTTPEKKKKKKKLDEKNTRMLHAAFYKF